MRSLSVNQLSQHNYIMLQCFQLMCLALLATAATGQEYNLPAVNSNPGPQDGRIVGGWETNITHFPHQVSLQMGNRHICGGTIIAPNVILTAAHCLARSNEPLSYAIRAGSTMWSSGGSYIRARRIVTHPQFNAPTHMNNDIALIWLQRSLVYSPLIQAIPLVTPTDNVLPQAQLFVSGWGSTTVENVVTAPRLHYTFVVQMDRQRCTQNYFGAGTVTGSMFCAGSKSGLGDRDSCMGDSGGPLITSIAGRFKLLGIVSWGLGCANAQYPGVYTYVTAHTNWLTQTLSTLA
ncbi:trypsin beta [Drosophila albomicans]|uniref:Trypsin beta n=1 Tax=Drosophila albomicans TaxID=7291 RepID=A0A6P8XB30_DROAB|nr:trypsin beta [Drosophila albomicans]